MSTRIQASLIAEEVLRENADAVRVLFNKFHSAISFKPTMATVLNAEVGREVVRVMEGRVRCARFGAAVMRPLFLHCAQVGVTCMSDLTSFLLTLFFSLLTHTHTHLTLYSPFMQAIDRQLATEQGSKLDTYELEVAAERGDVLQDLAEFQLAAVSVCLCAVSVYALVFRSVSGCGVFVYASAATGSSLPTPFSQHTHTCNLLSLSHTTLCSHTRIRHTLLRTPPHHHHHTTDAVQCNA